MFLRKICGFSAKNTLTTLKTLCFAKCFRFNCNLSSYAKTSAMKVQLLPRRTNFLSSVPQTRNAAKITTKNIKHQSMTAIKLSDVSFKYNFKYILRFQETYQSKATKPNLNLYLNIYIPSSKHLHATNILAIFV